MKVLEDEAPARVRRIQHVLALCILLGFIVLAWRVRPEVGIGTNDELEYRALSQSLEHGEYREIFAVGAPRAHKYPPMFPAWLTVLRAVTGDRFEVVRAANLAFFAGALLIIYLIGSRIVNGWAALATIGLVAVSPYTLRYASSMMSEPLYLFLTVAALAMTFVAGRHGTRAVVAAMTFALLAFLTRSVGITIVAAIGVWSLTRRSPREIVCYALAAAIVVGGWFAYSAAVTVPGVYTGSYERELVVGTRRTVGAVGIGVRARAIVDRLGWVPTTMDLPRVEGSAVDNVVTLAVVGTFLLAGLIGMWKTWPAAVAYTTIYILLMVGWPYPSSRLHLPILPLTLLISALGAMRIGRRLPAMARAPLAAALVIMAALNPVRSALASDLRFRECDRSNPYKSAGCFTPDEQAVAALSQELRDRSQDGDVVAVHTKPASVYFLSGRRTVPAGLLLRLPSGVIADTLRARSIKYLLLTRYTPQNGVEGMARALSANCRDYKLEASAPAPHGFLVSVRAPGDTAGDSCAALAEYERPREPAPHR